MPIISQKFREMSEKNPRAIKLLCPSLSKIIQLVAWDEQKIDLGSIAQTFGLDPLSIKINGHFISKGVDFISSSVTWKSLLSFFSAKGLSTGKDDRDALIVDGKLCKVGNKRARDLQDAVSGICKVTEDEYVNGIKGMQLKNKKLRENKSGEIPQGLGLKRKQLFDDVILLKKLKINEEKSDIEGKKNDPCNIARTKSPCSWNLKRTREDQAIVAAPCKRIK
ncbi:Amino acid-ligase [Quillaja saponaria]|uniref:Amino acid-ligase n=1 Tax=Quillaja saponaria TaxID=32244 RepID=A0AAD7PCF2_QUISA|nr:Amino acid-ligase [Quillaja saponaria]